MSKAPEDMDIDPEDPPSQFVDRARKRGLGEHEEQEYGTLTNPDDPGASKRPDGSDNPGDAKKRRVASRSKSIDLLPRFSTRRDSAFKQMVIGHRLSWSGGQHRPTEATSSKPPLGDKREQFTFLVPLRFQQSVASYPAPLRGGQWKYTISHGETNVVTTPESPDPMYLFRRSDKIDMEDGSSSGAYPPLIGGMDQTLGDWSRGDAPGAEALTFEAAPSAINRLQSPAPDVTTNAVIVSADATALPSLRLSTHTIEDTPSVMANPKPSAPGSDIDSTSYAISSFTQRRGLHSGAEVQGQLTARNHPFPNASLQECVRGAEVLRSDGSEALLFVQPTFTGHLDSLTPMVEPKSGELLGGAISEVDMSNHLSCIPENSLDGSDVVRQGGGQAEQIPQFGSQPVPPTAERAIPLIPTPPAVEEPVPPIAEDPIAPADAVPNPLPASATVRPPVKESTPSVVKCPAAPTNESPNPSVTKTQHTPFAESISRLAFASTQDPQSPPHLHAADAMVDGSDVACVSRNQDIIQHTTFSTRQEQDDEEQDGQDELVVDALLAVPLDLDTTLDPHGTTGCNNTPQEKEEGSVRVPTFGEVTASPTGSKIDSAIDSCNSSTDIHRPSTTRPSQRDPEVSPEALVQTPCRPRDTYSTTTTLSNAFMVQESETHPLDPRSVVEVHPPDGPLFTGALRKSTAAGKRRQSFVTPQHSPISSTLDGLDTALSSPIVEGGSFWNLDIGEVEVESQTDFIRACIDDSFSRTNSQGSEELYRSDKHQQVYSEQGFSDHNRHDSEQGPSHVTPHADTALFQLSESRAPGSLVNSSTVSRLGVRKPYARPTSQIPSRMYKSPRTPRSLATGASKIAVVGHQLSDSLANGTPSRGPRQEPSETGKTAPDSFSGAAQDTDPAISSLAIGLPTSSSTTSPDNITTTSGSHLVLSRGLDMDVDQPGLGAVSGCVSNANQGFATMDSPFQPDVNRPIWSVAHGTLDLPATVAIGPISNQTVSTTPMFSLTINPIAWPSSGITRPNIVEVAQHLDGLRCPTQHGNISPVPTVTSGISHMDVGIVTLGEGCAYSQDDNALPGPVDPPQQQATASETDSRTSQMIIGHLSHGRTSTPPVTTLSLGAPPALGRPNQSHTGELPPSPTTPTPVSSGQRRWRSRQPNTVGQEIPEMLGEMKNVIIDLATSVNGLKDAVSDFRSSQRTPGGFGSAPVQRSGKGKGKARMGGGNSNSGRSHGDTGRESQAQSAGGHVGDDYVADDESRGDDGEGSKNLKLRDDIRKHAVSLLGTPKDGTLTQKVTKADADAFDPLRQIPCTADDFKLHLAGTPAHPWNKAATAVFVQSFCAKFSQYGPEDTENHFKVHLATLIRKYKSQQSLNAKPGAVDEAKAQNRKNTRKASLFAGRMKTIRSIPELQRHESAVGSLGCAGMSSDETSTERGLRVYRIRKKRWRAAEVGTFLHAIDRVTEQTKNITTSRGSTKYHRLPGEKESQEGGIVSGLPINFYSPTWLANLRAHMKPVYDSLNIKHEVYPLVHDQIIQQIAIQNPGLAGFMFR